MWFGIFGMIAGFFFRSLVAILNLIYYNGGI